VDLQGEGAGTFGGNIAKLKAVDKAIDKAMNTN
jgi:hypothetical protein